MAARIIAQDDVSITIGWDAVTDQWGYVPTIDGSEILTDGKRHIGKSATKRSVKIGKPRDGKRHTYGVKVLAFPGPFSEVLGQPSPPPGPVPNPPPGPGVDNSLAQSWLVLAERPADALDSQRYYKFAVTADLGYREWYTEEFFRMARGQSRVIVPWCDCIPASGYHPGVGTGPDVAIQWMRELGAPFWMGQAESPEQFDNAMNAEVKPRVIIGDIAHCRPDQIERVKNREVLFVDEAYRNCSRILDPGWPDWKNANAGIGGNCIAVYEEGPCQHMPVSEYLRLGLFVAHRDSAYGGQMTVDDYRQLP